MLIKKDLLNVSDNNEEKIILSKVYDKYIDAYKYYEVTYTDFLNPIIISKLYSILKNDNDIDMFLEGGFKNAERNIIVFANNNLYENSYKTNVTACKILYNERFSKSLKHKDFLGSLLGLGLKREKIGDIKLFQNYAIAVINEDILSYIKNNLEYVGKTKVKVESVQLDLINELLETNNSKEQTITVSSVRIDAIIATTYNLSRSNAQKLIKSEKVFLNWSVVNSTSRELKINDVVTVRGSGRFKIMEYVGTSKKGKYIINIKIY